MRDLIVPNIPQNGPCLLLPILMAEIYSKNLVRAFGRVLLMKFR